MARQLRKPSGSAGHQTGLMMNKANEQLYRHTINVMKPATGDQLLEIGFGNGKFFGEVFQSAPDLHITGIDYSALMVNEAAKDNQLWIDEGKLRLVQGNSDQMPFDENSFDKIFCINVVYFWDDAAAHLQEIKRVLKPCGRFYATIRTKKSMELMPFTNYNFTKYDESDWQTLVNKNGLQYLQAFTIDEPETTFRGETFRIQSICLVAAKP
ncbi:MAG: class I SAM-dependent methyltransferase [Chitinophagaceae bacterium]|nr:class I SAM-dependent methyltransferase [Chitinophagaceae bacterium]